MPGWQIFYHELKDKNFEIVSVAQDTGGVKDASPWIEKANPEYTVLIDEQHLVTKLYSMVNVPTAVWINRPSSAPLSPSDQLAPAVSDDGGFPVVSLLSTDL